MWGQSIQSSVSKKSKRSVFIPVIPVAWSLILDRLSILDMNAELLVDASNGRINIQKARRLLETYDCETALSLILSGQEEALIEPPRPQVTDQLLAPSQYNPFAPNIRFTTAAASASDSWKSSKLNNLYAMPTFSFRPDVASLSTTGGSLLTAAAHQAMQQERWLVCTVQCQWSDLFGLSLTEFLIISSSKGF